ncbi:MAG: hypothetical protein V3U92_05195 [Cellulophaga sp.]
MLFTQFISKSELTSLVPEFTEAIFGIDRERVTEQLKPIADILIDNIVCFIEYPYVDKFHRDSYYSFFSKKHNHYDKNSIRISFFNEELDVKNYFSNIKNNVIEDYFLGFISLRPTTYRIIGHSFINPRALKNNNFVCCLSSKKVLINGRQFTIHGFPYCSQDNESISCSEAAIINLFDYFGNKYSEYSTILPSQVAKVLSKQSYQRQLPTNGLPTENISYVLKKMGFGTVVYSCDDTNRSSDVFKTNEFKELMYIYIESGIPIIATLSSVKSHHAVIIIGRKDIKDDLSYKKKKSIFKSSNKEYIFSSIFKDLLVMDDNHPPYKMIDYDKPIFNSKTKELYQFKSFIVPLYSKVHLDAFQFKKFFYTIIENFETDPETKHVKFRGEKNSIYRFFLASSRSYKNYIVTSLSISDEFKAIIVDKSMPKFIWIGEIINGDMISVEQKVESIIAVDATESGLTGHLIFATNSRHLIINNTHLSDEEESPNKKYQIFDFGNEIFYTFASNLKGVHTQWKN